jgi:hypothetical protein
VNDHLFASSTALRKPEFGLLTRQKRRIGGPQARRPAARSGPRRRPGLDHRLQAVAGVAATACARKLSARRGRDPWDPVRLGQASRFALAAGPVRFSGLWGELFTPAWAKGHPGGHLERYLMRAGLFPAIRRGVIVPLPGARCALARGFAVRPEAENGG